MHRLTHQAKSTGEEIVSNAQKTLDSPKNLLEDALDLSSLSRSLSKISLPIEPLSLFGKSRQSVDNNDQEKEETPTPSNLDNSENDIQNLFRSFGDYKSPFSKHQTSSASVPQQPQKILKPDIQGKGPQVKPLYPGPSVNQLVDQFAYPNEPKEYGGKGCSCANCPKKVDASCSCAEPYKDALWNFIQCMQACIESVLTEIDKIRAAQEFHGQQQGGKFARSLPDLDRLREVVLEYKNKLTNFDHLKTLTYQTDGGKEVLVKTLEELSPILMLKNIKNESDAQPTAVEILSSIDPELIKQLDDVKICDFRTFIKKVVDMLKRRELTYEQIRELCLLAIKQCVESEQNLTVTDNDENTDDIQNSQEIYPKISSNFNR